jgi:carboxyl-terminal processing protease
MRSTSLVLLLAAACTPLPNPFESESSPERVFAVSFENLVERYIEPRKPSELALAGLAKLSTLDEAVAVSRTGNFVEVNIAGIPTSRHAAPEADDIDGWALLTANVLQDVRKASPAVRTQSDQDIYEVVFKGIFSSLDKYSRYRGPEAANHSRASRDGFGGLGVVIKVKDGVTVITRVLRDTPARRAGLKPDDRITVVDGKPIRGLSQSEVIKRLRGDVDEVIALTIMRGTPGVPVDFSLIRMHIIVPTVEVRRDASLLRLKISGFNQGTARSVRRALDNAEREIGDNLKGLIIDLRNNPGGLLDQAVEVADIFIESGRIISTEGRHSDSDQMFDATSGAFRSELPIAVLINGRSASAAEVLAVSLRDLGRATVLGSSSYGKGTVQTILALPNGGEIIVTWARLHAPSGQTLHKQGVVPAFCTNGHSAHLKRLLRALNAAQKTAGQLPPDTIRPRSRGPHYSTGAQSACPPNSARPEADLEVARMVLTNKAAYAAAVEDIAPSVAERWYKANGADRPGP